jgi:hypothetical protein
VVAGPARFQSVIEARRQQGSLAVLSTIDPVTAYTEIIHFEKDAFTRI